MRTGLRSRDAQTVLTVSIQRLPSEPYPPTRGEDKAFNVDSGRSPHDPIRLQDEGGIDYPLVFKGLEAISYDGYVTVHQAFRAIMEPEDAAEQSYVYLKPFCG